MKKFFLFGGLAFALIMLGASIFIIKRRHATPPLQETYTPRSLPKGTPTQKTLSTSTPDVKCPAVDTRNLTTAEKITISMPPSKWDEIDTRYEGAYVCITGNVLLIKKLHGIYRLAFSDDIGELHIDSKSGFSFHEGQCVVAVGRVLFDIATGIYISTETQGTKIESCSQ